MDDDHGNGEVERVDVPSAILIDTLLSHPRQLAQHKQDGRRIRCKLEYYLNTGMKADIHRSLYWYAPPACRRDPRIND